MTKSKAVERILAGGAVAAIGAVGSADAQDVAGFYGGLALAFPSGELDFDPVGGPSYSFEGSAGGLFVGYNMVNGGWVYGGELGYLGQLDTEQNINYDLEVTSVLDLRARVGRVYGNTLIYGALGYSWVQMDGNSGVTDPDAEGVSLGVGFETAVGSNGFIGGDITTRNLDIGGERFGEPLGNYINFDRLTTASIRVGLRF